MALGFCTGETEWGCLTSRGFSYVFIVFFFFAHVLFPSPSTQTTSMCNLGGFPPQLFFSILEPRAALFSCTHLLSDVASIPQYSNHYSVPCFISCLWQQVTSTDSYLLTSLGGRGTQQRDSLLLLQLQEVWSVGWSLDSPLFNPLWCKPGCYSSKCGARSCRHRAADAHFPSPSLFAAYSSHLPSNLLSHSLINTNATQNVAHRLMPFQTL